MEKKVQVEGEGGAGRGISSPRSMMEQCKREGEAGRGQGRRRLMGRERRPKATEKEAKSNGEGGQCQGKRGSSLMAKQSEGRRGRG